MRRGGGSGRIFGIIATGFGACTAQAVCAIAAVVFFLLFEQGDGVVDHGEAGGFGHARQGEEGVLLEHYLGVGDEVVEHLRAAEEFGITLALLIEQADGFGIAGLGFVEALTLPIEVAETAEEYAFFGCRLCGAHAADLIGFEGVEGVASGQVDVADGIVDAVEIVLVVRVAEHAFEARQHLLCALCRGDGFSLEHAGLEGEFVAGTLREAALDGTVGGLFFAAFEKHLREEIVQTGFFETVLPVAGGTFEVGEGFGGVVAGKEEVGERAITLVFQALGKALAGEALCHVFGVVEPTECDVTADEPDAGFSHHVGFGGIEAGEMRKGGSGGEEIALLKLGFAHQQPRVFEIGIELLARQVGFEFGGGVAADFHSGFALDAVELDGFFALGDGALEMGLAESDLFGIAHGEDGQAAGEVLAQAGALRLFAFLVGDSGVVEHVVAGHERLPPPRNGGVLLRGAAGEQHAEGEQQEREVFDEQKGR